MFQVLEQSNFTDTGQDLDSVDWDHCLITSQE